MARHYSKKLAMGKYLGKYASLNTTTKNIHNLEHHKVLIILKDGTNITDWKDVADKSQILLIREDLSGYSDMSERYAGLKSVEVIVISGLSDRVANMKGMFYNCHSLAEIHGLEDSDISGVKDMSYMFYDCWNLEKVPMMDISSVSDMSFMFSGCHSLSDISALAAGTFLMLATSHTCSTDAGL